MRRGNNYPYRLILLFQAVSVSFVRFVSKMPNLQQGKSIDFRFGLFTLIKPRLKQTKINKSFSQQIAIPKMI